MSTDSWKSFEKNEVTHSMAHYLMAIRTLLAERGYARATDIAEHLDITRASASVAISGLRAKGLVDEDERHFLKLTDHGEDLARTIVSNRLMIIRLLRDVLLIDPVQAEEDACKMEHLLSSASGLRLFRLLGYVFDDPNRVRKIQQVVQSSHDNCPGIDNCDVCSPFHECILSGRST